MYLGMDESIGDGSLSGNSHRLWRAVDEVGLVEELMERIREKKETAGMVKIFKDRKIALTNDF